MSTDPSILPEVTAPPPSTELDHEALLRVMPKIAALNVQDMPRYTLDATFAAGTAFKIAARLETIRADLVSLPREKWNIAHLDGLVDLARSIRYLDTEVRGEVDEDSETLDLSADGHALRGLLLAHAEAASFKGLIKKEVVAKVRDPGDGGHRDLIEDLQDLVRVHLELPDGLVGEGKMVSPADLDRAAEIAHALNQHVGNGVTLDLSPSKLADDRRKVAGLLLRSQDQLRRALTFLRWSEGDAAKWVPTLYRTGTARKTTPTEPELGATDASDALQAQAAAAAALAPEDNPFAPEG